MSWDTCQSLAFSTQVHSGKRLMLLHWTLALIAVDLALFGVIEVIEARNRNLSRHILERRLDEIIRLDELHAAKRDNQKQEHKIHETRIR